MGSTPFIPGVLICYKVHLITPQISAVLVYDESGSADLVVHNKIASCGYVKHTVSAAVWDAFSVLLRK